MFRRAHRFHLIVDVTAIVVVLALLGFTRNPWGGLAGFSVLAAHAVVGFRVPRGAAEDERDTAHQMTAARAGFAATWVVFVLVATSISVARGDASIPTWTLNYLVMGGWLVSSLVASAVALNLDRTD